MQRHCCNRVLLHHHLTAFSCARPKSGWRRTRQRLLKRKRSMKLGNVRRTAFQFVRHTSSPCYLTHLIFRCFTQVPPDGCCSACPRSPPRSPPLFLPRRSQPIRVLSCAATTVCSTSSSSSCGKSAAPRFAFAVCPPDGERDAAASSHDVLLIHPETTTCCCAACE